MSVFSDDLALTIPDERFEEERFVTIGLDGFGRVLVVVYTLRDEAIRIISARQSKQARAAAIRGRITMEADYNFSQGKRGAIDSYTIRQNAHHDPTR